MRVGQTRGMSFFDELNMVDNRRPQMSPHSDSAHWLVRCPTCDSGSMLAIAVGVVPAGFSTELGYNDHAAWLMCSVCGMGSFAVGTPGRPVKVFPRPWPFAVPDHLEDHVRGTWIEALRAYAAEAFTSSSLMCRKIVFHMAVEAGLPAKNDRGFAPNFEACVKHLVKEEYITKRQQNQWVDSIRQWGNKATHELEPINREVAYSALEFTLELLRMVYSFPGAAAEATQRTED